MDTPKITLAIFGKQQQRIPATVLDQQSGTAAGKPCPTRHGGESVLLCHRNRAALHTVHAHTKPREQLHVVTSRRAEDGYRNTQGISSGQGREPDERSPGCSQDIHRHLHDAEVGSHGVLQLQRQTGRPRPAHQLH